IGNWSEKTIAKYREDPNIHFAGYVEDLVGYCKRSAMLVPVRIGSGIRAKILVAMAQGLPLISTTLGCEGIKVKDNESIMIADTAAAFGKAYKTLLEDSNFSFSLVQSAQSVANKYYSQRAAAELRMKYFEEILRR
ncbi:MAG TPA: glycosyltransferase family 4 protein, partial [Parafilimonas sp.]|nr:glycosyltransferase family 4 protein [Parafilimonas sp.]